VHAGGDDRSPLAGLSGLIVSYDICQLIVVKFHTEEPNCNVVVVLVVVGVRVRIHEV